MASHLQKPVEEVTQSKLQADPSATDPTHSDFVLPKGGSPFSDAASCISSAGEASTSAKDSDLDHESDSLKVNNSDSHSASEYDVYWHQGHGGSNADLASQRYLLGPDALELQYPVMQADNGSFVYLMPGLLPGYCTYFPVNTVGADGQYLSQDTYSPSHILQSPIGFPEYYPAYGTFGDLQFTANPWEASLVGNAALGNGYEGFDSTPVPNCKKASIVHTANTHSKPSSKSDLSYSVEKKKSAPMLDVSSGRVSGSQLKSVNNKTLSGGSTIQSDALENICCPAANGPTYNRGKSGYQYPYTFQNTKANVKGWASNEKQKMRSKKSDAFLNEQNQGPNTANGKGDFPCNGTTDGHLASEASMDIVKKNFLVKKDDYNLPDFPTKYEDALFFVIKSYSEDDIHKSIKYNVWASTPNGNKRLDAAYQDAQDRTTKEGSKCPLFLFFSVNASGQFCGVAEMVGRVDFDKTMGFWQQDKWKGYFPVKWHIIKDVPNPHLRRIILENNENKPVTNSRDTQEVKFRQGIEFLNIFKNYVSKTSILDDFDFYESREKVMQEKRIRESLPYPVSMQLKVDDLTAPLGSVNISSEGHAGGKLGN